MRHTPLSATLLLAFAAAPLCAQRTSLGFDQPLKTMEFITNAQKTRFLVVQGDGNLCLYNGSGPGDNKGYVWCALGTSQPIGDYFAILQRDGNFCVYHGTGPADKKGQVWCSGTKNPGSKRTVLINDKGTLVIIDLPVPGPFGGLLPMDPNGVWHRP